MTGDVQSAVLVYLKDNPGSSIKQISEATGFSPTAVRNNLRVMERRFYAGEPWHGSWVQATALAGTRERRWSLTYEGLVAAGYRTVTTKKDA